MEYQVVYALNLGNLMEDVNSKLKEGWKLQGGVSVAVFMGIGPSEGKTFARHYQALVKDKD